MRTTHPPRSHLAALLCAIILALCAAPPALAAQTHYPISVETYTMGDLDTICIRKVYQLSLADDPGGIPTGDFERNGMLFHLLDMTKAHDVGVDSRTESQTVTLDSDTGEMAQVLKMLEGQKEITTEDGYSGILTLDHTSVTVKAKGYRTSTKNLSASRTYANLSDADLSLIPKTIEDGGRTLTLNNVQWSSDAQEDGSQRFTAAATYSGTATSRYATGYTVTAEYTGEVVKTNCEVVTYTAIFTGTPLKEGDPQPEPEPPDAPAFTGAETDTPSESSESTINTDSTISADSTISIEFKDTTERSDNSGGKNWLPIMGCVGGMLSLIVVAFWFAKRNQERRDST